jgi:hypothetical protein
MLVLTTNGIIIKIPYTTRHKVHISTQNHLQSAASYLSVILMLHTEWYPMLPFVFDHIQRTKNDIHLHTEKRTLKLKETE